MQIHSFSNTPLLPDQGIRAKMILDAEKASANIDNRILNATTVQAPPIEKRAINGCSVELVFRTEPIPETQKHIAEMLLETTMKRRKLQ